jgi:hypothetical protein
MLASDRVVRHDWAPDSRDRSVLLTLFSGLWESEGEPQLYETVFMHLEYDEIAKILERYNDRRDALAGHMRHLRTLETSAGG